MENQSPRNQFQSSVDMQKAALKRGVLRHPTMKMFYRGQGRKTLGCLLVMVFTAVKRHNDNGNPYKESI